MSGISDKGTLKENLEQKLESYEKLQILNVCESISQHQNGRISFREVIQNNRIYFERMAQAGKIKHNWYEVSPDYRSDQEIRNENLGYKTDN